MLPERLCPVERAVADNWVEDTAVNSTIALLHHPLPHLLILLQFPLQLFVGKRQTLAVIPLILILFPQLVIFRLKLAEIRSE